MPPLFYAKSSLYSLVLSSNPIVPPLTLFERTRHDRNRPLLQVEDPLARLKDLYVQRDPIYRELADLVVDGGRFNASGILQILINAYEERWKR